MISKFTLLRNLLLASVALAAPPSWPGLARGGENRQSRSLNHIDLRSNYTFVSNPALAGSVLSGNNGTFTSVWANFIVPTLLPGTIDDGVSMLLGIDGVGCTNAYLWAGVMANITIEGVSHGAWFEFYPRYMDYFQGVEIRAGDLISINVTALTATTGLITIKNLSRSQSSAILLRESPEMLCRQDAEWVIQDYQLNNGSFIPLSNFGEVIFTDAAASDANGKSHSPSEGDIYNIVHAPVPGSSGSNSDLHLYTFASVNNQYDVFVQRLMW